MLGPIATGTPLVATITVDPARVQSGLDFRGSVRVTNDGSKPFDFESGWPVSATVFRRGTDEVVGGYSGGIGGVGFGDVLQPGESVELDALGGTASCDPALGYALPPGTYDVRAQVDQYTMHENAPTETRYLVSDSAALTIAP
jgi:hypothetical protein